MPDIAIMAAMSTNRVIGREGQLPWDLPADLARVHQLAAGKTFIMGRNTYESPDVILSDTKNIILSKTLCKLIHPNSVQVGSMSEAMELLTAAEQVLIMGGVYVYQEALQFADRMYLTFVHAQMEGDAFFPEWPAQEWQKIREQYFQADQTHAYAYSFVDYQKK